MTASPWIPRTALHGVGQPASAGFVASARPFMAGRATGHILPFLAVIFTLLALACGSQATTGGGGATSGDDGTPRRGGTLRIGWESDSGGFDVQKVTDVTGLHLLMPIHSQLIRAVPNKWTELEGDLATKWEPSADGKIWTFTLRTDAKWHDGKPVTADDIVYSFNRMLNPPAGFKGGNAGCLKEVMTAFRKIDETHVQAELMAPAVSFLQCAGMAYIRVEPKHIIEPIDTQENSRELRPAEVIGAGPYKFKSYDRGSLWLDERNPDSYDKDRGFVDAIQNFIIPDLNTRLASLRAGQLDMMRPVESLKASQAAQLKQEMGDKIVILKTDEARLQGMFFNTESSPFKDIRLRRAAHLAINRQAMIEFLQEGEGFITPPICSCWPYIYDAAHYLTLPGYRPDKTADLQEAKRLVDEATGGRGLDVTLTSTNTQNTVDFAQLVQSQLKEIGIRATLDPGESAIVQARYRDGKFQFAVHPGAVPFLDPDSMISRYFLPKGDRNWARWTNDEFNQLYAKESVDQNQSTRAQSLRRMADILQEELPVTGLTDQRRITPVSNKVHGFDVLPPSVNADLRMDWVWLSQ